MKVAAANKFVASLGHGKLEVSKADGVWYLIGGEDDERYDETVERCLHVVRLDDLTEAQLRWKIEEMTR